jgi:hypothetical protein
MNSVLATFSFATSPQVGSGDRSEKSQKGFLITHVGIELDGDGFPRHMMLSPSSSSGQVPRRTSQSRSLFNLGSDPSPLAQDDTKSRHQLFDQCLKSEILVFTQDMIPLNLCALWQPQEA